MEYYTAMKKNELKTTWINLKNLTLKKSDFWPRWRLR